MKILNWKIWLSFGLVALSVALYASNYLIFRDANYMFRLFLAQLGFLPISVLLVTIIVNQLLARLAPADLNHLALDLERANTLLISEWLAYMRYLKSRYPYLFSLALRTNPFDPEASPEIRE